MESRQALGEQVQTLSQKLNELQTLLQLIIKYVALLAATKLETQANAKEIGRLQQLIEPALRTAKQRNEEIRTKVQGTSLSNSGNGATSLDEVFQNVPVMGDDYFYRYQTAVAGISALFAAFQDVVGSVQLYTAENTSKANLANDAYWSESNSFYGKQSTLEKLRIEKNGSITTNKNQQRNKIQAILDQAKQSIGGCGVVNGKISDDLLYDRLQGSGAHSASSKGYYQKYREANAQETTIGSEIAYDLEKSEPVSLKAMDMLEVFNNAAESMRNELYVNEFALTKFNFRTLGFEKDQAGNPKSSNERIDPSTHALANQEVEYLLYGFSSCAANISSAYAEMFAFRMAIRTLEALLDTKKELLNIGSPLLVFLAAAAEGAHLAFQDMTKLVKGEAVELSEKITISALSLTYKDYLRIFLLMHSNNTKLMARMQALIELETGKDLMQAATYIQGNAYSDVKLWFIPQMMKLLDGSGLLGCKVTGNRCQFTRSAAVAY
ncbi:hypothetical protein GQF04_07020 [Paenibacillus aceris]|nr:hypothetical protein [Paenibacillus aceris]NHW34381.1 hypothetical protein [Paenibacillus aceris]